jgi:hypothetical protein
MRALACAAVVVASVLATSACAGSRSATKRSSTDAIQLHQTFSGPVPASLRNFVRSLIASPEDGPVNEVDVYGPGSRSALVEASSGDGVTESAGELKQRFYLVVLHGQFVCDGCSGPAGHKPPRGTIETHVWSSVEKSTDFGISGGLPAAVSRLNRLAVITTS